jgi:hypothetical protein
MSEHPDTDALEEADFHKYSDDEAVPISCYHRMVAHARDMEGIRESRSQDAWRGMGCHQASKRDRRKPTRFTDPPRVVEANPLPVGIFRERP